MKTITQTFQKRVQQLQNGLEIDGTGLAVVDTDGKVELEQKLMLLHIVCARACECAACEEEFTKEYFSSDSRAACVFAHTRGHDPERGHAAAGGRYALPTVP